MSDHQAADDHILDFDVFHMFEMAEAASKELPEPGWPDLAKVHECGGKTSAHEVMALILRRALDNERKVSEELRQSMETLCEEMEKVKAEAKKVYVMGPGVEEGC